MWDLPPPHFLYLSFCYLPVFDRKTCWVIIVFCKFNCLSTYTYRYFCYNGADKQYVQLKLENYKGECN